MKVLGSIAVLIMVSVPLAGNATTQELKSDPLEFENCSVQTNELTKLVMVLDRYRLAADEYNERHDLLRRQLDGRETDVQRLNAQIEARPADRSLWKEYETAYANYEVAMQNMREWNEHGDRFSADYQLAIDEFHTLRSDISAKCDGGWELGVIRKYCDKATPAYKAFCKQFES